MAYVIAVCGSGGKTTLVKNLAKKYADENKKVCITTSTHMWYDDDVRESLIVGTKKDVVGANFRSPRTGELCEPKHMSLDEFLDKNKIESGKVYYIANLNMKKELITPLNDEDYKLVCEKFDYVIVEADGSRSMPMKIPHEGEPAIPSNVNEIIVVVGMEAIGREIGIVCHRFNEFYGNDKYLNDNNIKPDTIVSEKLIDDFVGHYYYEPLKEKYSSAKVTIYKNQFGVSGLAELARTGDESAKNAITQEVSQKVEIVNEIMIKSVAIVLCASGFSKRFGSNKLMIDVADIVGAKHCEPAGTVGANARGALSNNCCSGRNKKLYQFMIDELIGTKEKVLEKFSTNDKYKDLKIDVVVVSQYDEILNDKNYNDKVIMLKNDNASEGLSTSIKLAVKFCEGSHSSPVREGSVNVRPYDAIVFVNADMPLLPESELANFIYNSILNINGIAAMYTDDVKNPAYFEKKYFDELSKLEGDKGARELLNIHFKELYKYYTNDKYLIDIDVKEDLELLNC